MECKVTGLFSALFPYSHIGFETERPHSEYASTTKSAYNEVIFKFVILDLSIEYILLLHTLLLECHVNFVPQYYRKICSSVNLLVPNGITFSTGDIEFKTVNSHFHSFKLVCCVYDDQKNMSRESQVLGGLNRKGSAWWKGRCISNICDTSACIVTRH